MKKLLIFLILLILFCVFFSWYNNNPQIIISKLIKNNFRTVGDLRYRIYFLGVIPVGEAVFSSEKIEQYLGEKVYHLSAQVQNSKIYHKISKVTATVDSYVDMQNLSPVFFQMRFSQAGKEDVYKKVVYDQKNNVMSIAGIKRQILPNTQDPLSAMFNLSRMDLSNLRELEMSINTNQKNYVLRGKIKSHDITINKEVCKIFVLEANISRRDKNPYHKTSASLVLLKKERNIPVLIKVFASGILINAKLIEIK